MPMQYGAPQGIGNLFQQQQMRGGPSQYGDPRMQAQSQMRQAYGGMQQQPNYGMQQPHVMPSGFRQQGGPRGPQADLRRQAVMPPPGSAQRMTPEAMQQLNPKGSGQSSLAHQRMMEEAAPRQMGAGFPGGPPIGRQLGGGFAPREMPGLQGQLQGMAPAEIQGGLAGANIAGQQGLGGAEQARTIQPFQGQKSGLFNLNRPAAGLEAANIAGQQGLGGAGQATGIGAQTPPMQYGGPAQTSPMQTPGGGLQRGGGGYGQQQPQPQQFQGGPQGFQAPQQPQYGRGGGFQAPQQQFGQQRYQPQQQFQGGMQQGLGQFMGGRGMGGMMGGMMGGRGMGGGYGGMGGMMGGRGMGGGGYGGMGGMMGGRGMSPYGGGMMGGRGMSPYGGGMMGGRGMGGGGGMMGGRGMGGGGYGGMGGMMGGRGGGGVFPGYDPRQHMQYAF